MVVEELVAKLGFKVDGLGDLKKFEGGLKRVAKGVSDFGTALNRSLSNVKLNALNGVGAIGGKLAQGFKAAASSIAIAAAGAARMAAGVAAVSVALVGAVALAAKLAYNFVKARGEAARMRREAQLDAMGDRATVGGVESLQKGLDAIATSGALKDVAKTFISNLAEEADAEIRGEGDGKYKKAGIKLLDDEGNQRDTAEVAKEIMARYADMAKKGQQARRELTAEKVKADQGKGDPNAIASAKSRANKAELEARKFASDFGIKGTLAAALSKNLRNGADEFLQRMKEANANNPNRSQDEEDAAARRAKEYEGLRQKVEGLSNGLQSAVDGVKDSIADRLTGALDETANALLGFAKRVGLVNEGNGEKEDRAKAKAAAAKDPDGIAAAQKAAEDALRKSKGGAAGSFMRWFMGMSDASDKLIEASQAYKRAKANREANAGENVSKGGAAGTEKIYQDAVASLLEAFKQMQDFQRQNTPDAAARKANEKVEKKEDKRSYNDIGNDKRQITNSVTVNATGLEEVAAKVKAAVLGAISTKAANTSTAALNAP